LRKKAKAHKKLSKYTITEDDINLITKKVQDRAIEEFKETQHQQGKIQEDLAYIRKVLE
jgi:hypothetical protein